MNADNFSQNLYNEMKNTGTTYKLLSDKTGISIPTIYNYTAGTKKPNLKAFMKICDYFGKTPNDMLKGKYD